MMLLRHARVPSQQQAYRSLLLAKSVFTTSSNIAAASSSKSRLFHTTIRSPATASSFSTPSAQKTPKIIVPETFGKYAPPIWDKDELELIRKIAFADNVSKDRNIGLGYFLKDLKSPGKAERAYYQDELVAVIYDAYAKSKYHLLIMPKTFIVDLRSLTRDHLPLLEHMLEVGTKISNFIKKEDPTVEEFKIGFHAVPSMNWLHCHLISTDFDSENLKNKKHYNSFTTKFFIDIKDIIKALDKLGAIRVDVDKSDEVLKGDMFFKDGTKIKNIPHLKKLIQQAKQQKQQQQQQAPTSTTTTTTSQ